MNVFFNTEIENSNCFSRIGDAFFSPIRQLFNGRTVCVIDDEYSSQSKRKDEATHSLLERTSTSSCPILKTVAAIAFLIPGLCLGVIFKGLSYLSYQTRKYHRIIHNSGVISTPTPEPEIVHPNYTLGSPSKLLSEGKFRQELDALSPHNNKIGALIIYPFVDEHLFGSILFCSKKLLELNPQRIILVGYQIQVRGWRAAPPNSESPRTIPESLYETGEWLNRDQFSKMNDSELARRAVVDLIIQIKMDTISDALAHKPPINPTTNKPYRMIYIVPRHSQN